MWREQQKHIRPTDCYFGSVEDALQLKIKGTYHSKILVQIFVYCLIPQNTISTLSRWDDIQSDYEYGDSYPRHYESSSLSGFSVDGGPQPFPRAIFMI